MRAALIQSMLTFAVLLPDSAQHKWEFLASSACNWRETVSAVMDLGNISILSASLILNLGLLWRMTRAKLGSVINGHLAALLILNVFDACLTFYADTLISSFSILGLTVSCSFKYVGYFLHRQLSIMILTGSVFLRCMMVIRGEDIRDTKLSIKPHQASLKII